MKQSNRLGPSLRRVASWLILGPQSGKNGFSPRIVNVTAAARLLRATHSDLLDRPTALRAESIFGLSQKLDAAPKHLILCKYFRLCTALQGCICTLPEAPKV